MSCLALKQKAIAAEGKAVCMTMIHLSACPCAVTMSCSSETLCECEQIVEQDTLREVDKIKVPVVAAVAAHFGSVRLIDNIELQPPS
jgi:pantothenate synthetase